MGENLLKLYQEIITETYRPSRSIRFIVRHPKPREIFAAHFRDRIVHHLLVSRLTSTWERKFSPFSFACRTGRGTHGAVKEIQKQVRRISQGGQKTVYALQLDLASFFVTISRSLLCGILSRHTNDKAVKYLIQASVGHDARIDHFFKSSPEMKSLIAPGKSWLSRSEDEGIPIGNLTSQFGANVYLNDLDHWIVRQLKPMGYLRYMDDLTLFHTDLNFLEPLEKRVDDWLVKHRKQRLNTSKTVLKSMRDGINYLGYRIIQNNHPSEPAQLYVSRGKKWDFVKDVRDLEKNNLPIAQKLHPLAVQVSSANARTRMASLNARLSLMSHANSYQFRKKTIDALVKNINSPFITLTENGVSEFSWQVFKIKPNYEAIKVR